MNFSTIIITNVVLGLKNRILRVCHYSLVKKILVKLNVLLINDSYPKPFAKKLLFSTPHNRNNRSTANLSTQIMANQDVEPVTMFASFPYINTFTTKPSFEK